MKTNVTFEYVLTGSIKEVSLYFSDFNLFGKHHPYMTEVTDLKSPSSETNTYNVQESLKLWGFIPMKPNYDVEVCIVTTEKHIRYQSEVSKGVFLDIDYTFIEDTKTNTVKVVEAMILKGYPIINPIFIGLLKKSRKLLFESIRKTQAKKYPI